MVKTNISVYLFGDLGEGYTQYIDDSAKSLFQSIASEAKANSQLVVHRDQTLMYYTYIRRLHGEESFGNRYIGICYVLNNRLIKDIDGLFSIFEGTITTIASRGILLEYSNNGSIIANVGKIYNAQSEFAHISAYLKNELDSFMVGKNDSLPPLDYSINTSEIKTFKFDTPRDEIIDSISTFSSVFIFKDENYENAKSRSISSKLFRVNKEIKQLQGTIVRQDTTISDLKKQKNKFKWVLILLSIIFIGAIVFFIHNNEQIIVIHNLTEELAEARDSLKSTSAKLKDTKNTLTSTKKALSAANTTIKNLEETNRLVTDSLRQAESELTNKESLIIEKDKSIADLRAQVPKNYKTRYNDQYLYNKCGSEYTKSNCYFSSKGSIIIIYYQNNGYGLTHEGGWIPMNCLEK